MAEMFLKLDQIDGESLDHTHHDEIEITDWQWDTINTVRWDINQGGQSTKVDVQAVKLTKICDKASVTLYQNCVTGKHIREGKITCRKNDGDQKVEYFVLEMKDIMITKVHFEGQGGDQSLKENVELSFAEFRMDYRLQHDTGNPAGSKSFQFHIQKQHGHAHG